LINPLTVHDCRKQEIRDADHDAAVTLPIMTTGPTLRAQIERLIQLETKEIENARVEKTPMRQQLSHARLEALREVLWLMDGEAPAPCDHEWVMHLTEMPHGQEKPGSTSCRKCGAVGTEIIASGTTEIEPIAPVPSEEDLFRLARRPSARSDPQSK
jgi:hypothetical protein